MGSGVKWGHIGHDEKNQRALDSEKDYFCKDIPAHIPPLLARAFKLPIFPPFNLCPLVMNPPICLRDGSGDFFFNVFVQDFACMRINIPCACSALRGQKRASDPTGL